MNQHLIECTSLSKTFRGKRQTINAVTDINLHINQNELILLKGRSGAGKSTLLNLMCGLIKPTSGSIRIEDDYINTLSNSSLSSLLVNRLGIIFQSFNLLPTYTVYENIEVALVPKGFGYKEIRKSVMPLLEQFNLADKINSLPSELSVGQQQKVAIIRTLAKQPSIIFADEPTGSVDDETAREILDHLKYLNENKEVTIVIATHGSVPEAFADRVVIIENGRIKS
jgi:acetoin utilization transport system ATP-binding protein